MKETNLFYIFKLFYCLTHCWKDAFTILTGPIFDHRLNSSIANQLNRCHPSNWLTHSFLVDLIDVTLAFKDAKNFWCCYCCWCWCWRMCWQQFGRDFEAEAWLKFWSWILVTILKLWWDFEAEFTSWFWGWNLMLKFGRHSRMNVIKKHFLIELYPRVRFAFGNILLISWDQSVHCFSQFLAEKSL